MEERSDLLLPHINECRHDIFKLIKNCRPLLHKTVEVYHQKVEQYVTEIDKSIAFLRTCNIINAFYSTDAIWDEVEKNLRDERNETGEKKYSDDDIENGRKMTHAIQHVGAQPLTIVEEDEAEISIGLKMVEVLRKEVEFIVILQMRLR